ncbi:MAG TPA: hypothetical protein VJ603_05025 [Paucimonas sp.]|nr:hypothetical protein [Paucimonas sp.]HJW55988.1 hypothetical protein [Burkholderiaceae bacterium]
MRAQVMKGNWQALSAISEIARIYGLAGDFAVPVCTIDNGSMLMGLSSLSFVGTVFIVASSYPIPISILTKWRHVWQHFQGLKLISHGIRIKQKFVLYKTNFALCLAINAFYLRRP